MERKEAEMDGKTKERYEKAVEGLSQAIFHFTWLGHFWGFRGVIVLDEIRSWYIVHKLRGDESGTLSARSSTYYAAAGNAKARASQSLLAKPWWFILTSLCFMRSMRLSNRLVKLVGIKGMNPDQLDVRSHILRRTRRYREALECVNEALSRASIIVNSRTLLLMGKAESLVKIGRPADAQAAYRDAMSLVSQVPVSTHVRLLRSFAAYRRASGHEAEAQQFFEEARLLATQDALGDQVKKIEASL